MNIQEINISLNELIVEIKTNTKIGIILKNIDREFIY